MRLNAGTVSRCDHQLTKCQFPEPRACLPAHCLALCLLPESAALKQDTGMSRSVAKNVTTPEPGLRRSARTWLSNQDNSLLRTRRPSLGEHTHVPHGGAAMRAVPRRLEVSKALHNATHLPVVERRADHDAAAARTHRQHRSHFGGPQHACFPTTACASGLPRGFATV